MAFVEINDQPTKATPEGTDVVEIQATGGGASAKATLSSIIASLGSSVNILSKNTNYTVLAADLSGYQHLVVLVDSSVASRTITLPAPSVYDGKTITVIASVDPAGNSVITNSSGASEFHTGYAKNDFVTALSDGTNNLVLDEFVTVKGKVKRTDNTTVNASSAINAFGADYTVEENIGGWWDSTTNHRLDNIPFACEIAFDCLGVISEAQVTLTPYINSTDYLQIGILGAKGQSGPSSYRAEFASGDDIEIRANNGTTSSRTVYGNAGGTLTQAYWRVVRRLR